MINKILKLLFTLLILSPSIGLASDLYHKKVHQEVREGKDLIMVFDELERREKFSIVRVKHTSGASVPSIMFMVEGCYEIAKLRGEKFFINLKEWSDEDGNWVYKIGYTSDKMKDPKKYFGEDIDKTKELEYLSVQEFTRIFERKEKLLTIFYT